MTQVRRRSLAEVLWLGAEGAWLWAALSLVTHGLADGQIPVWLTWAFFPAGVVAAMALRGRFPSWRSIAVVLGFGLAVGFVALSVVMAGTHVGWIIFAMLIGALLAWRGWAIGGRPVPFTTARNRFQAGCAAVVGIIATASLAEVDLPLGIPLVVAFFVLALMGLALARAEWHGGAQGPASTGVSMLTVGLALVAGVAIALVAAPAMGLAVGGVHWLWDGWVSLISSLDSEGGSGEPPPAFEPPPTGDEQEIEPRELSDTALTVLAYIGIAIAVAFGGMVIAMLVIIAMHLLRHWAAVRQRPGVQVEQLSFGLDWRGWLRGLRFFFVNAWRALGRRFQKRQESPAQRHYRQLQRWGRRCGLAREPHQTPTEYQALLSAAWPEFAGAFERITRAYVVSRYSRAQPDSGVLEESARSWETLKAARGPWRVRLTAVLTRQ